MLLRSYRALTFLTLLRDSERSRKMMTTVVQSWHKQRRNQLKLSRQEPVNKKPRFHHLPKNTRTERDAKKPKPLMPNSPSRQSFRLDLWKPKPLMTKLQQQGTSRHKLAISARLQHSSQAWSRPMLSTAELTSLISSNASYGSIMSFIITDFEKWRPQHHAGHASACYCCCYDSTQLHKLLHCSNLITVVSLILSSSSASRTATVKRSSRQQGVDLGISDN